MKPRLSRPSTAVCTVALTTLVACPAPDEPPAIDAGHPMVDAAQPVVDAGPPADASEPREFTIRVLAIGVLEPLTIELAYSYAHQGIIVSGDGLYEFPIAVATGQPYAVELVSNPLCVLENERGTIGSADVEIVLACEGAPVLTDLVISGMAPELDVSLARTEYLVDMPLSQESVTVTPVALRPESTITVAGHVVASGTASPPLALSVGDNMVEIMISHPAGLQRVHHVNLRRSLELAQFAYLKASNTDQYDGFGGSVSLSGDTLAVGARRESSAATGVNGNQDDDSVSDSGAVYLFRRQGPRWAQEAYLKASNTGAEDGFGANVSLSGDTLAVGAYNEDSAATGIDGDQTNDDAPASGAVYVFRRTEVGWVQEAYLKASDTRAAVYFGIAVSLSGDTLAVGTSYASAVYVFRRTETGWAQEARLTASNPNPQDGFGNSVAISGDLLAVGASCEQSAARGVNGEQSDDSLNCAGAVYTFRRTGTNWAQEAYIKASNTDAEDDFGQLVALSDDTLAVAAPYEDGGASGVNGDQGDNTFESGAVYVFRRTEAGWAQEAYVKASRPEYVDLFGTGLALAGDLLAVGAIGEDSQASGTNGDQTDNSLENAGAVYLFRRTDTTWMQESYIKPSNPGAGDSFGYLLALAVDTLVVGGDGEDSAATGIGGDQADNSAWDSGAVYVFH